MKLRPASFYPAILFFIVTTVLLVIPGNELPKTNINYFDKFVHVGLFFVLTILFLWPFRKSAFSAAQKRSWFFSIMLYAIAYGIIMEFVQKYFVPNRSYDEADMLGDAIGSVVAYIAAVKLWAKK